MAANNDNGQLVVGFREPVKTYAVYDGSGRLEELYEARANARNGDPCFKTEYAYDGATSRVIKMQESNSTWDSSWDI